MYIRYDTNSSMISYYIIRVLVYICTSNVYVHVCIIHCCCYVYCPPSSQSTKHRTRIYILLRYLADDALGGLVDSELRPFPGLRLLGLVAGACRGRLLSVSSSHCWIYLSHSSNQFQQAVGLALLFVPTASCTSVATTMSKTKRQQQRRQREDK